MTPADHDTAPGQAIEGLPEKWLAVRCGVTSPGLRRAAEELAAAIKADNDATDRDDYQAWLSRTAPGQADAPSPGGDDLEVDADVPSPAPGQAALGEEEREAVRRAVHLADDRMARSFALLDLMREVAQRPDAPELEVQAMFVKWADEHREQSVDVALGAVDIALAARATAPGTEQLAEAWEQGYDARGRDIANEGLTYTTLTPNPYRLDPRIVRDRAGGEGGGT